MSSANTSNRNQGQGQGQGQRRYNNNGRRGNSRRPKNNYQQQQQRPLQPGKVPGSNQNAGASDAKPSKLKRILNIISFGLLCKPSASTPAKARPIASTRADARAETRAENRGYDTFSRGNDAPSGTPRNDPRNEPRNEQRNEQRNEPRNEPRPPREPQPPRVRTPHVVEAPTSERLYVGNLSYDATEEDLAGLFNGVGRVRNAEVVINHRTQRSKGYAFVAMSSLEEAVRAVNELHNKEFMGRPLIVGGAKASQNRESNSAQSDEGSDEASRNQS